MKPLQPVIAILSAFIVIGACSDTGPEDDQTDGIGPETEENEDQEEDAKMIDARLHDALLAPDDHQDLSMTFRSTGGAPGERFVLELEVGHDGVAEYRFLDELRDTAEVTGRADIRAASWSALREALAESLQAGGDADPAPLVPDSVVARWVVAVGDASTELVISPASVEADTGEISDGNRVLLDTTYRVAAELIGPTFLPPDDG